MPAPYDPDGLYLKAKLFINRALDEEISFDEAGLWASLALELLAKSALARVSPLLIADITVSGKALLVAAGISHGHQDFVTVKAKTLFDRCKDSFPPFNDVEANKIAKARNAYLHSAEPVLTRLPEDVWWPKLWAQCVFLLDRLDKTIEDFVGRDRKGEIQRHLQRNARDIEDRTQSRIAAAKQRLASHTSGTARIQDVQRWKPGSPIIQSARYAADHDCPACDDYGWLGGDAVLDSDITGEFTRKPVVNLVVQANEFVCANCGLELSSAEMIAAAGLPEEFHAEGDEDDLSDYFEPEYGND